MAKHEKKISPLALLRSKIFSDEFKDTNRLSPTSFTRERTLMFSKMILIMTRKSVKSLQNILNETETYLSKILDQDLKTVSNSAYSQVRRKLNYIAFTELSRDLRDEFYKDEDEYHKFKGFRLLGVDGSIVTLPNNKETQKEFGTINVINQYKDKNKKIVQARASLNYSNIKKSLSHMDPSVVLI